jgi:hypothetical protein
MSIDILNHMTKASSSISSRNYIFQLLRVMKNRPYIPISIHFPSCADCLKYILFVNKYANSIIIYLVSLSCKMLKSIVELPQPQLVRKGSDANEHERLSNITLRHK